MSVGLASFIGGEKGDGGFGGRNEQIALARPAAHSRGVGGEGAGGSENVWAREGVREIVCI